MCSDFFAPVSTLFIRLSARGAYLIFGLSGWALIRGGRLFEVGSSKSTFLGWGGWDGHLLEAGHLLTFSTFRVGTYSRWPLIQGWGLKRINTVIGMSVQSSRSGSCT